MKNLPSFEDIVFGLCNSENENMASDYVNLLLDQNILQQSEIEVLNVYNRIKKDSNALPTIAMITQLCPNFRPQQKINIKDMNASIRMFVKDRINKEASRQLLDLASIVSKEGIGETVSDSISKLLKSDTVVAKYENIFDRIGDIYTRSADQSGIKTLTGKIDEYIGGLKPGQVSVIAAYTGQGKSTFCVGLTHSAIKQGYNVCYLSLELNSEHILYDLISRHSVEKDENFNNKFDRGIIQTNLKNKTLSKEDWDYTYHTILPDLSNQPGKVYILDEQDIEAYSFFAFDNKLQEIDDKAIEETGHGIDLIVVDHVQQFQYNPTNRNSSVNDTINVWVDYFRRQALDFLKTKRQVHVTLCAQLNRQGWTYAQKHEGMYHLTALKEANEIETSASIIITLFSDAQLAAGNEIKFAILKNRDGERMSMADTIYCDFAHQLIGGDNATSSQEFKKTTMDDLQKASDSSIDISQIQHEMNLDDELAF